VFFVGVYPIASEAFGTRKPYVTRAIAIITVLTSAWFWCYEWSDSPRMLTLKNLMLWSGEATPSSERLDMFYAWTNLGDSQAYDQKLAELEGSVPDEELSLAAHRALEPEQRCFGEFRASQLITHAFLHADILHLAGNLLFLMVFGSRVNALIGNIGAAIVYPLLAIAGGVAHLVTSAHHPPTPMVGASGAIMGLAGMYLVLFPAHKVHMAAWFRWGLIRWFELSLRIFAVRGFWVVAVYIAIDVFYTAIGIDDGVAHWAHLGGFGVGALLAVILLVTRLINARGGDLLSIILGKHAWRLVGMPNRQGRAWLGG
jgi:membrane associated rhomboid family serine protease